MTHPQATLANRQPAYTRATPRLRQSDIDRLQAWKASDIREARTMQPERTGLLKRLLGRGQ